MKIVEILKEYKILSPNIIASPNKEMISSIQQRLRDSEKEYKKRYGYVSLENARGILYIPKDLIVVENGGLILHTNIANELNLDRENDPLVAVSFVFRSDGSTRFGHWGIFNHNIKEAGEAIRNSKSFNRLFDISKFKAEVYI